MAGPATASARSPVGAEDPVLLRQAAETLFGASRPEQAVHHQLDQLDADKRRDEASETRTAPT